MFQGVSSDELSDLIGGYESTTADCEDVRLAKNLARWTVEERVSKTTVTRLLKIMREHSKLRFLPSDVRSLLGNRLRKVDTVQMEKGNYYHFGLRTGLSRVLYGLCDFSPNLKLLVNVDGVSVSNSSVSDIWPIQCMVYGLRKPFVIGVRHGAGKPCSPNAFLANFVKD